MSELGPERRLNTELPGGEELSNILEVEAQRDFPEGKEQAHYPDFQPAIEWLKRYELPTEIFEQNDMAETQVVDNGKQLVETLADKMLSQEPGPSDIAMLDEVYDYLSEEDKLGRADMIFVFGSKTPVRIEKAIELYEQGLSNRIMISGGNPFYGSANPLSEAERYKQLAVERGVPAQNILTEDKSVTIPDNVRSSLNYLDDQGIKFESMILVNSPYTQRRGWVHFKKYLPDSVLLNRVNSSTIEKYERDNWYKNPDGIKTMANEFIKMKVAETLNTA